MFFLCVTILFIVISLLCVLIILYLHSSLSYWRKRNICGPTPELWYGCFKKSLTGKCNLVEELDEIYKKYKLTQKFVGVYTARTPKLFILDPILAKKILITNFRNFRDNEASKWSNPEIDRLRTKSPFVSTGEAWKERRAELTTILATGRIRAFHEQLKDSAIKLVHYIERHIEESIDPKELINRYTADFMASFIWSIKTHTDAFDDNTFTDVHKMANKMIEQALRCVRYYIRTENFPWLRKLFSVRFFTKDSDEFFEQLADYVLKMRAEMTAKKNANTSDIRDGDQSTGDGGGGGEVINLLLQLRNKKSLNIEQIAGHTTTIMIDGFETGAIVTAHLLLLLARNPRVQHKLRVELIDIDLEKCTYDSINNLEYLDQCLNETLRLFPPLTTLFKKCTETFEVENKNGSVLEIEPSVDIFISSYSFQRDAEYYVEPETFWPERFAADAGGIRKFQEMGVFFPFGDGPRICPGMKLGIAEVKLAVVCILKHFTVKLGPGVRLDNKIAANSFLLSLDGGIKIQFEKL